MFAKHLVQIFIKYLVQIFEHNKCLSTVQNIWDKPLAIIWHILVRLKQVSDRCGKFGLVVSCKYSYEPWSIHRRVFHQTSLMFNNVYKHDCICYFAGLHIKKKPTIITILYKCNPLHSINIISFLKSISSHHFLWVFPLIWVFLRF